MAFDANPGGFGSNRWGEVDWAKWHGMRGPRFRVGSSADLQPVISTSQPRTIMVRPGLVECCGVSDSNDADIPVQFEANTGSTDRFDYLVARFDWATRSITCVPIKGTSSSPTINASQVVNSTQVNRVPGVQYDGQIALVRVPPAANIFAPGDLYYDLRMWGGDGLITNTVSGRNLLDVPLGGMLYSGAEWLRRIPSGLVLERSDTGKQTAGMRAAGGWTMTSDSYYRIRDNRVEVDAKVNRAAGQPTVTTTQSGNIVGEPPVLVLPASAAPLTRKNRVFHRPGFSIGGARIEPTAIVHITDMYPNATISAADQLQLQFEFFRD